MIKFGTTDLFQINFGDIKIKKVYLGVSKVFPLGSLTWMEVDELHYTFQNIDNLNITFQDVDNGNL